MHGQQNVKKNIKISVEIYLCVTAFTEEFKFNLPIWHQIVAAFQSSVCICRGNSCSTGDRVY